MSDIKNYHTEEHSLSNGQVLMRNYTFEEATVVVREMTDVLVLDLVEKGLVTNSVTLWIAYDHRFEREPSKGTVRFPDRTNRSKEMIDTVEALYRKIADPHTGIRRIEIIANKITPEGYQQYTLFQDSIKAEKERHLQEAVLQVKKRYGKNAIMRGSNLLECSTYRERNNQVAIYAVLVAGIQFSDNLSSSLFGVMAYTVILCFSLFKTGSLSKSIFNAH